MTVKSPVALITEGYEIIFLVVSEETSKLNVMYLKILQAATMLATPAVSVQNLLPKPSV